MGDSDREISREKDYDERPERWYSIIDALCPLEETSKAFTKIETEEEMKDVIRRLKKKKKKKREKHGQMVTEKTEKRIMEEREEEWVAEVDTGILLTLVSEHGGGNRLVKIYFREDWFSASDARMWWMENCETVVDLYSINISQTPNPLPDNEEEETKPQSQENECDLPGMEYLSIGSTSSALANRTEMVGQERRGPNTSMDCIVQDYPGVFLTIRCWPDGRQELHKVEIRDNNFGKAKVRVWWEQNKPRLYRQYTRPSSRRP